VSLKSPSGSGATAHYLRVKRSVVDRIAKGSLKPGARVPSENELVREFGLSRMTVNRALRELAADGVLQRIAGVGTFVAEQRVHAHPLQIRNIADEIRERGHEYRSRVILLETVNAPADIAERCGVRPGSKLDHSMVVHYESDIPLQVEDRYVNPVVVPGYRRNDFTRITPNEFLMQAAPLQRAEHIVRASMPNARIRKLLRLNANEACLIIHRRTWSQDRIATVAELHHPGSRYELSGSFAGSAASR
jgi:GntR family histidine utilization transcriptional repressor